MGVTRQAARQLADGLVQRGYASLASDPEDARRTLVALTESGVAYGRAVWETQDWLNAQVRSRVSPQDLAIADSVLRAVFPGSKARERIDEWLPAPDQGN
jgi:DNA-binding MarR family transcriptional regulator